MHYWTDYVGALPPEHLAILQSLVGDGYGGVVEPDLEIRPDGKAYIFRWYMIPRREVGANVYLHLQVANDPERPLHDHPWHNQSAILAGGYREIFVLRPDQSWLELERECRAGDTIQRQATEAHRLELLDDCPYVISLFSTGPVLRDWGFWFKRPRVEGATLYTHQWVSHEQVTDTSDGVSSFKEIDR